jgi:hypothetical protein
MSRSELRSLTKAVQVRQRADPGGSEVVLKRWAAWSH